MRLWSIHPKYLDAKGLVALWREALLAKHVLEGKTKGYKNHPQLNRFKSTENPILLINQYLSEVYQESQKRGYSFDKNKIEWNFSPGKLTVTSGQLNYERKHILKKLLTRDLKKYKELVLYQKLMPNPIFEIIEGEVEDWEIL